LSILGALLVLAQIDLELLGEAFRIELVIVPVGELAVLGIGIAATVARTRSARTATAVPCELPEVIGHARDRSSLDLVRGA
jgi:hypothetical protein